MKNFVQKKRRNQNSSTMMVFLLVSFLALCSANVLTCKLPVDHFAFQPAQGRFSEGRFSFMFSLDPPSDVRKSNNISGVVKLTWNTTSPSRPLPKALAAVGSRTWIASGGNNCKSPLLNTNYITVPFSIDNVTNAFVPWNVFIEIGADYAVNVTDIQLGINFEDVQVSRPCLLEGVGGGNTPECDPFSGTTKQ